MNNNFKNIWSSHSDLKFLPFNIKENLIFPINILSGASPEFIKLVVDLELTPDQDKRSQMAIKAITDSGSLREISYKDLGKFLRSPNTSLEIWRQLYLLERSIPSRFNDTYTWYQRLCIFKDTYLHEQNLHISNEAKVNNQKIRIRRGSKNNPTNHDKLVCGYGKSGSDFYYFDDSISGTTIDKMVSVEFKYCAESTLSKAAAKYATGNYTYKSTYIIVYMEAFNSYFVIDYSKYSPEANEMDYSTKLNVLAPTNLILI